ncbi:MAG: putative transport protein [Rhodothermales bacterium]
MIGPHGNLLRRLNHTVRDGRHSDRVVMEGQTLLLLGRQFRLEPLIALLGSRSPKTDFVLDTERHRMRVVATSPKVVGHRLGELQLLGRHGVSVARIERHEGEFVPDPDDSIQWGDALLVVGEPDKLADFAILAGHREHAFDLTDLVSLSLGIVLGILLGSLSFGCGGQEFKLGLVGGPLVVALVAAHFGRIGRITASVPRASRLLMLELGLVLFLADAGVAAGGGLAAVLAQHGVRLALGALMVVAFPLLVGAFEGLKILGIDFCEPSAASVEG